MENKPILSPQARALSSSKVIEAPDSVGVVRAALLSSFILAGFKIDSDSLQITTSAVLRTIEDEYCNMRIDELSLLMREGIRGRYGEYCGISYATITRFMRCYMQSPARYDAVRDNYAKALPAPSGAYNDERIDAIISASYANYVAERKIEDSAPCMQIVDRLVRIGKVRSETVERYIAEATKAADVDRVIMRDIPVIRQAKIFSRAYARLLSDYFKMLITKGK